MPFQGYEIDDSFLRTDPGRPRVPQGYYLAEVAAVRPTPKDYEKTPGYYVDFRIAEAPASSPGAGVGRTISRYAAMGGKPGSQFGMAGMIGAAGLAPLAQAIHSNPNFRKVETWEKHAQIGQYLDGKMKGRKVVLTITDEISNQGRPFSSIFEVMPAENWTNLKQTPLLGGDAGAPVPAPSNGPTAPSASLAEQVQGMFEQQDVNAA